MTCMICKHGDTVEGTTSVILEKNGATIVFKHVPAEICSNCGERYIKDVITRELLKKAQEIINSGVQVDIREYSLDAA